MDLPNPGIKLGSPALQADSLPNYQRYLQRLRAKCGGGNLVGPRGQSTLFVITSLQGLENICLPNIFFHLHVNCLLSLSSTKQLLPTSSFVFKMVFKVRVLFISVSYSVFLVLYHVAFHSITLAWRIPGKEEPGELQSKESDTTGWQTHTLCTHIVKFFFDFLHLSLVNVTLSSWKNLEEQRKISSSTKLTTDYQ